MTVQESFSNAHQSILAVGKWEAGSELKGLNALQSSVASSFVETNNNARTNSVAPDESRAKVDTGLREESPGGAERR